MGTTQSIVGFPDHITTVLTIDELRAMSKALFATGLTEGWPLSEQPGFATAGVRFGNLNVEICAVDREQNQLDDWLTFEPTSLDSLADDLAHQGIGHDPFDAVVVQGHPVYTRVGIPALATSTTALQLCHTFYPTRTTGPIAPDNAAGIHQVVAIDVVIDAAHREVLTKLLEPRDVNGSIAFTEGPDLRLTSGAALAVKGFSVTADDPAKAVDTLVGTGMHRVDDRAVQMGSLTIEFHG